MCGRKMPKEVVDNSKEKMEKSIDALKGDLNALRAGRANPSMLDRIMVDYYGTMTPVPQMASVAAPEPRTLTIQPWDVSALPLVEKAIMESDLGLNPSNDGKLIRLSIPQLTEERRKELSKLAHKEGENAKVAVRNIRRHGNQELKNQEKSNELTEDDLKDFEKDLQKLTDEYIKKIDAMVKEKEKEITTI